MGVMGSLIAEHGTAAEARLQKLGVPLVDLRALAPHLESCLHRLGRLCVTLKPRKLRNFVVDYFTPALGATAALRISAFAGTAPSSLARSSSGGYPTSP